MTQESSANGLSVVTPLASPSSDHDDIRPPYTVTAPSAAHTVLTTAGESPYPPPFSSLFFPSDDPSEDSDKACESAAQTESPPAFAPAPRYFPGSSSTASAVAVADTKAALPRDTKDGSNSKDIDDGEPPPPYSEGFSPLDSFTYVMASAGGPASILTQVSQHSGGPPINTLGGSDENITLELR